MAKNRLQFDNTERERFSNFVVDLSRLKKQTVAEVKAEEVVLAKKIGKKLFKLESRLEAARPDLLGGRRRKFSWPKIKIGLPKFKLNRPKLSLPRPALKFNFSSLGKIFKFKKNHRYPWLAAVRAKQEVFASAPLVKTLVKHRAAKAEKARRLENAETTAIWYRSIFSFAIVLILIILPFKVLSNFHLFNLNGWADGIRNRSELALNNLMAAADAVSEQDFKGADTDFQSAGANFLAAADDLGRINDSILALASFSSDPRIKLAAESKKFLTAGAIASSLGRNLVQASDSLFNGPKDNFPAALDNFLNYGHQAAADASDLKGQLARINPDNLPLAYQAKFNTLRDQAGLLADNLVNFVAVGDKLKEFLGVSRDKRYLVVFQNNAELRASGGFLGSYALVDFRDGKIRNLEVPGGGSYDTEAGLKVRVAAPQPLWLVNPLWHFWDANWWPDWPTTAKNLMWFYERSDGPSVDGVISVTPTVVERLLEITGPIDLTKEYGLTIDSANFWQTVEMISEQDNLAKTHPEAVRGLPATSSAVIATVPLKQGLENNAGNKPKKIIGDLLAKILEVLPSKLNKESLLKIISIFEENMSEKQILLYFTDPSLQAEIENYNWAGEVRRAEKDYLLVVNTNIAGQKTDRLIDEKIEQTSEVAPDGAITDTVVITRTHNGVKREALTGVRNVDWLRVYVPQGSELISAEGFTPPDPEYLLERPDATMETDPLLAAENAAAVDPSTGTKIYPEDGKTVFANWTMVDPGQSQTIVLKYRLPFNLYAAKEPSGWLDRVDNWLNPEAEKLLPYSLLVQKQPGAKPSAFTSRLALPDGAEVFWRYPESLTGAQGWEIADNLNADKFWSILVKKK